MQGVASARKKLCVLLGRELRLPMLTRIVQVRGVVIFSISNNQVTFSPGKKRWFTAQIASNSNAISPALQTAGLP